MVDLASDILRGATAIAEEVFGSRSIKSRRKIYHLHARRALPTWIEGNQIVSTRSALRQHYATKQAAAMTTALAATPEN
jgi:hypothetical protein